MKRWLLMLGLLPADAAAQVAGAISVDAMIDAYYAYDFTRPANRVRPFATQPARHNEFNLNLAMIRARYSAERIRASLGLATGTYVEANYAAEPELLKNVFEGYAGVRLGGSVWLDAGVLPSHIGFESAITTLNATYSRSLIAEYSPYFETGARVTFDAGERVTAAILVVNGWQSIRETNDAKAVGVQLVFRPMDKLVLNYGNYLGDEAADEAGAIDSNRQPDQAVVATGTSTGFEVVGASVNPDHRPADHMLLRLEARLLAADNAVFPGRDGIEKRSSLLTSSMSITF